MSRRKTRRASQKQYRNWIKNRLKQFQDNKLTQSQRDYYRNKALAQLTSGVFDDLLTRDKNGNIILSRKRKGLEQALEHAWNILKKAQLPNKLSQKSVRKEQEKEMLSNTFSYLYNNFTESEVQNILPDRDEKGQFSQKDYQWLLHLQENTTTQELQERVDKNNDANFFI